MATNSLTFDEKDHPSTQHQQQPPQFQPPQFNHHPITSFSVCGITPPQEEIMNLKSFVNKQSLNPFNNPPIYITVVGNIGCGKSSTCNMLAGSLEAFRVNNGIFPERLTRTSKILNLFGERDGPIVKITDTPSIYLDLLEQVNENHFEYHGNRENLLSIFSKIRNNRTDILAVVFDGTEPRLYNANSSNRELINLCRGSEILEKTIIIWDKWNPDQYKPSQIREILRNWSKKNFDAEIPCFIVNSVDFFKQKYYSRNLPYSSMESLALREEAAHARSRIWEIIPEATFNLDGKILTKPSGSKKSAKRKSKNQKKKEPKKKNHAKENSEDSSAH